MNLVCLCAVKRQAYSFQPSGKSHLISIRRLQGYVFCQGMVTTLKTLNLRGNPLEFPPPRVLERGVGRICSYLRQLLVAKLEGREQGSLNVL